MDYKSAKLVPDHARDVLLCRWFENPQTGRIDCYWHIEVHDKDVTRELTEVLSRAPQQVA